jgi:hypothetical protein
MAVPGLDPGISPAIHENKIVDARHKAGHDGVEACAMGMLTKDLLFGMNALSLAGFALMFAALNLSRQPKVAKLWSIGLMCAGTVLLFVGVYFKAPGG